MDVAETKSDILERYCVGTKITGFEKRTLGIEKLL